MKAVRTWLLIFLAVLLPVRGAVAAAMLCVPSGVEHHQTMAHHVDDGADDGAMHMHDVQPAGHHDHGSKTDTSQKCNACSACCTVAPMAASTPILPVLSGVAEVRFPTLAAPAPTFVSDGQERPPRTS